MMTLLSYMILPTEQAKPLNFDKKIAKNNICTQKAALTAFS